MANTPKRVQLSRSKGWRMPRGAVKVDRTTRWGNPFDVREYGLELALSLFEDTVRGHWCPAKLTQVDAPTAEMLFEAHARWLKRLGGHPTEALRAELRGKHLGCWCALPARDDDDRCHAAILLRIANEPR